MKPMAMRNRTSWVDGMGYWCRHYFKGCSKVHPIALNGNLNENLKGKVFFGSEEKSGILCCQAVFEAGTGLCVLSDGGAAVNRDR